MWRNDAATNPEYATAKIAVWWDMNDCRITEGYDAGRIRPNIEGAFKKLGYLGPVSITAYADHKQTPDDLLRGLSSTGIDVADTKLDRLSTGSIMFSDIVEWRAHNPPPAIMMLITNKVEHVFSWDLVRIQQETMYNLFLAYSVEPPQFFKRGHFCRVALGKLTSCEGSLPLESLLHMSLPMSDSHACIQT